MRRNRWRPLPENLLGAYVPWLMGIVPRTALAVLWLATHGHEVESMVAQGLVEAAGLRRKQNWALILSSSARVSEVTEDFFLINAALVITTVAVTKLC